ncbi:MAG: hypothetical protein BAJALOKI3v1_660011 [Promethearchaeota archaeon]|nr:MAG: hypothetical protein BAJALOKI3v1_660011 [Candidatus Lokiarchaeota archaeon]
MKEESKEDPSDDEVEDYLDKIWENWSSRRMCEKTHKPNYIKKKND